MRNNRVSSLFGNAKVTLGALALVLVATGTATAQAQVSPDATGVPPAPTAAAPAPDPNPPPASDPPPPGYASPAGNPPAGYPATAGYPPEPPPPADPVTARRDADPSVDRNVLLPSAQTIPAGAVAINSYELFFAGLSYGISDHLQLSLTTMLPILSGTPFVLVTALKWNFHRSERAVVSVQPTVTIARENGVTVGSFGFSLMADRIVGQSGKVSLTGGLMTQGVFGGSDTSTIDVADGAFLLLWGSITGRVHKNVKLLGELILPGGYTWANGGDFELVQEALIFGYGVRFFGQTVAVDLSFLRPLDPNIDTGLIMGVPFVAFSAQF